MLNSLSLKAKSTIDIVIQLILEMPAVFAVIANINITAFRGQPRVHMNLRINPVARFSELGHFLKKNAQQSRSRRAI